MLGLTSTETIFGLLVTSGEGRGIGYLCIIALPKRSDPQSSGAVRKSRWLPGLPAPNSHYGL